jgi:hypothetical protein
MYICPWQITPAARVYDLVLVGIFCRFLKPGDKRILIEREN